MKYIIFKNFDGMEVPVLFPSTIKHSDMSYSTLQILSVKEPVSAGFIKNDPFGIGVACYGDSMTLNLPSREIDSTIVNMFLGLE